MQLVNEARNSVLLFFDVELSVEVYHLFGSLNGYERRGG
jgi:hypothetical protein